MDWRKRMGKTILNQQNDRLNYGEMLLPEYGYNLDFAVGLTYSLDLEALLGVPVSLGMLDDIDTVNKNNPYYLLEAIRRSADRIAIFCNAGSIIMPQNIQPVYILLENSVFQVLLPRKANFHPKLWVIKYTNDKGESYLKVIVLSRNLTFDRSFDLAVEMTGMVGKSENEKNRPLSDMLEYAAAYASSEKRKPVRRLAQDILRVKSFDVGGDFDDYVFRPFGFQGYRNKAMPLLANPKNWDAFIISPFISEGVLTELVNVRNKKTLVTRRSSLTNRIIRMFDDVYVIKDAAMTDEIIEDENPGKENRDIHAKLYFMDVWTGEEVQKSLLIGSLNASSNAFFRNVEFLLELKCKHMSRVKNMLLNDLLADENGAFEKIETIDETAIDPGADQPDFRDILEVGLKATASPDGERYSVRISIGDIQVPAEIAPLYRPKDMTILCDGTEFRSVLLKELSEFYVIRRREKSIVVKIPTRGIPEQERDSAIFKAIIGSKREFLKYVAFMLSDDFAETIQDQGNELGCGKDDPKHSNNPLAIYEKLLRAAARKPGCLDDIENVMIMLDENIVPDDFRKLIETVREASQKGRKRA